MADNTLASIDARRLMNELAGMRDAARSNVPDAPGAEGADFSELIAQYVNQVNESQLQARDMAARFEAGEDVQLIDVMLSAQRSRIGFEALTQVRNRFLSAYQEIMSMQV